MEHDDTLTTPLIQDENDPATAVNTPGGGLAVDTSNISESLHGNPAASPASPSYYDASSYWPTDLSNKRRRASYMDDLILQRQQAMEHLLSELDLAEEEEKGNAQSPTTARKRAQENVSEFVIKLQHFLANMPTSERAAFRQNVPSVEIRLVDLSYRVPTSNEEWGKNKIRTLYNTSPLYAMKKLYQNITTRGRVSAGGSTPTTTTNVLTNVNLVLKPSKMYLILGPPLSGKTSLLKAIAGLLPQDDFPRESYSLHGLSDPPEKYITGQILYNNLVCGGIDVDEALRTLFKNLVAFVRQSDDHAPRLTVAETLLFSGMCKDVRIRKNKKGVRDDGKVGLALAGLGLSHVKDTFVGNEQIRGVSGGQRRRVTLGEMIVYDTPLLCGDEISTGLDAASTVDILRILSYLSRLMDRITVVSLLQPSPEAVSLFDEVILLGDDGCVIFSGPTENAHHHFLKLGYVQPDGMDDADFLLAVASADRKHLYRPMGDDTVTDGKVHTSEQLGELFNTSKEHDTIMRNQLEVWENDWKTALQEEDGEDYGGDNSDAVIPTHFRKKYQNSLCVSTWLNFRRGIILWTRDYANIIAKLIQCFNVGLSTGFLFHNDPVDSSFFGAIYQVTVTIMSTSSTAVFQQWDDRAIFHKHYESNFYSALSFVLGKTFAMVPQMCVDTTVLGTLVYWIVGFVARAENFSIFLCLFFVFTLMMMSLFGFLASFAPNKSVYLARSFVYQNYISYHFAAFKSPLLMSLGVPLPPCRAYVPAATINSLKRSPFTGISS